MSAAPILIGGTWRPSSRPTGTFTAFDPSTTRPLDEVFPISSMDDVSAACESGHAAAIALRTMGDAGARIAQFLDDYAAGIEAAVEVLADMAHRETALPISPRLRTVELPRTTGQLRQAAAAVRDRSWCQATIDTKANIRSHYAPLGGPVVVFGPNNFPFAFNSVAGGDFAAAIAAGNPVIAKANTSHPGTTRLLADVALRAAAANGLPAGMVQLIYRTPADVGFALVAHPLVAATGFTGSKHAGLQLKAAADRAGKPIYLEMSSVNPVFVLPGALRSPDRRAAIAKELADSCLLGAGQFCTRPGLSVIQHDDASETLVQEIGSLFDKSAAGTLLGAAGVRNISSALETLQAHGAAVTTGGAPTTSDRFSFANTLLRVSGDAFLTNVEALQTEAFGTVHLVVLARDLEQMVQIAASLDGNLTGCIYSDVEGHDDEAYARLAPVLRQRVGRLLNDKVPTGVAVSPAMNHGGPFPATGHPGFTAVGIPASMLRFAALHCYDAVRPSRLPPELADANPTGTMWRRVDGDWTQRSL